MEGNIASYFFPFQDPISAQEIPKQFTYPFFYTPNELTLKAASLLQERLSKGIPGHNFGLNDQESGLVIGKMFGVMVVQTKTGEIGYLSAYSGKLGNSNHIPGFVPPVFDMLQEGQFFKTGEAEISAINAQIATLEEDPEFLNRLQQLEDLKKSNAKELDDFKAQQRVQKKERKTARNKAKNELAPWLYPEFELALIGESLVDKNRLRSLVTKHQKAIESLQNKLEKDLQLLQTLKTSRKEKSGKLQQKIFTKYTFLNGMGEQKSLLDIFKDTILLRPPAGAGECAAPKLLQFAFLHELTPLCFGEFWWGASPKSEVRKHKQFYPSCKGKCEPILGHMLQGVDMEDNPLLTSTIGIEELEIIYEDQDLLAVNKPPEFLSVPGRVIKDSVATRLQQLYLDEPGPFVIHRLDMSTSGVLLFARNEKSHKRVQEQFTQRTIKKKYVAILEAVLQEKGGEITLPLAADFDNRPQQKVCEQEGKSAHTIWENAGVEGNKTRVYFYPQTGRTHQLRVHAAHFRGLNAPIIGDDIYGVPNARLFLHAEELTLSHPMTKDKITIKAKCPF